MRFGVNAGRVLVVAVDMSLSAGAFFLFLSLGAYWTLPIEFSNPNAGKILGIINNGGKIWAGPYLPPLPP